MKKIISTIIVICLLFSLVSTIAYAEEDTSLSAGYINTINAKTNESASYQGICKNDTIYMSPNDIAAIGEYNCETLSLDKKTAESIIENSTVLSKLYSKLNLDKLFKKDKFEYLVFSRKDTTTDYITQIYFYDGCAQTMNKSFEIDCIKYDGQTFLNLEKMLYLMHAQWCVEESFLYYYPLDYNIFDFIGEKFNYMYENSVQHSSLLYDGENKWGHSTRIVLSHILNDVDMRIFIPFFGSDMIQQDWYEEAILQLATTDDSFIDDYGSKQISNYLKDSPYHKIETGLNVTDTTINAVKDLPNKIADTKLNKFSKWNDFSTINTAQLDATQKKISTFGDIVSITNILVDFNEINTRSKDWSNDFVNGLNILYTINEDTYGTYGKDILKVADDLLDEYESPTEEAAEAAMLDTYGFVLDKLLDKTIIGHIESIIALSNVIVKTNPNCAEAIENADLMNTVHALINVENVFLNEFVDSYHDYLHYLGVEDGSSSLRLFELMYTSINKNPQKEIETHAISDMRNALEMFLKTSLRNKTYVYHFSCFNGGTYWNLTDEAKALKEDIYKTYALLSELISTRDYDKLIYLDETYDSMYSNEYGLLREQLPTSLLTEEKISNDNESPSDSSEDTTTSEDTTSSEKQDTERPEQNEEVVANFAGGKGTQKEPYKVSTPAQLNAVRNDLSAHYIQINDIDMSGFDNWKPIGKVTPTNESGGYITTNGENLYFTGSYNGNNYKISNLKIYDDSFSPKTDCFGLFAGTENAQISNVNLIDIKFEIIKDTSKYSEEDRVHSLCVGGLVGRSAGKTILSNCSVSGSITVQGHYYDYVGGIVGYGSANNCTNYANINVDTTNGSYGKEFGDVYCGGISGAPNYREDELTHCKNYGNIQASGKDFVFCGGITGQHGSIKNCENHGSIIGKNTWASNYTSFGGNCNVGGISGATFISIENSINYGNVSSFCNNPRGTNGCGYAGGIVGFIGYNGNGILTNNYNYCEKIVSEDLYGGSPKKGGAGRIAGGNDNIISECYSIDTTTVDGSVPSIYTTAYETNGQSLTKEEIDKLIKSIK